jgi:hypothetical protein
MAATGQISRPPAGSFHHPPLGRSRLWHTFRADKQALLCWATWLDEERWPMPGKRRHDDDFNTRLEMEIITDAKPDELSIGWYSYLDDRLRFPFTARCIAVRLTSPLHVGELVKVGGMSPQDECEHEMFVNMSGRSECWRSP